MNAARRPTADLHCLTGTASLLTGAARLTRRAAARPHTVAAQTIAGSVISARRVDRLHLASSAPGVALESTGGLPSRRPSCASSIRAGSSTKWYSSDRTEQRDARSGRRTISLPRCVGTSSNWYCAMTQIQAVCTNSCTMYSPNEIWPP